MGNLISDFVKGKKKFSYPSRILQGITLHRIIDSFTDEHKATREAKEIFRPAYRLYSGAFMDVAYDHFLANDQNEFAGNSLYDFSQKIYGILEMYQQWLPERFALMFPYMKTQNWLLNYRTSIGIKRSFGGIVRRSTYLTESDTAFQLFERYYQPLQEYYRQFWQDLKPFASRQLELMSSDNNV